MGTAEIMKATVVVRVVAWAAWVATVMTVETAGMKVTAGKGAMDPRL
jgi:hypothetical protein